MVLVNEPVSAAQYHYPQAAELPHVASPRPASNVRTTAAAAAAVAILRARDTDTSQHLKITNGPAAACIAICPCCHGHRAGGAERAVTEPIARGVRDAGQEASAKRGATDE